REASVRVVAIVFGEALRPHRGARPTVCGSRFAARRVTRIHLVGAGVCAARQRYERAQRTGEDDGSGRTSPLSYAGLRHGSGLEDVDGVRGSPSEGVIGLGFGEDTKLIARGSRKPEAVARLKRSTAVGAHVVELDPAPTE